MTAVCKKFHAAIDVAARSRQIANDGDAKKLIKNSNVMIDGGYISLQSESHPIEFRNVEIRKL